MSRWCDHIALTTEEMDGLLEAAEGGDGALEDWFQDVGRKKKKPWAVAQDKAWELVHRSLTGDHDPDGYIDGEAGDWPLCLCILGGERLHEEWARSFWLVRPDEVAELVSALHELDEAFF